MKRDSFYGAERVSERSSMNNIRRKPARISGFGVFCEF
jgi:hypothetical protein